MKPGQGVDAYLGVVSGTPSLFAQKISITYTLVKRGC